MVKNYLRDFVHCFLLTVFLVSGIGAWKTDCLRYSQPVGTCEYPSEPNQIDHFQELNIDIMRALKHQVNAQFPQALGNFFYFITRVCSSIHAVF
jgi:hypothetical protein